MWKIKENVSRTVLCSVTHVLCIVCNTCELAVLQLTVGCHCHSLSLASVKSRLFFPFWYRLTWVVPDKGLLNVCVCVCVSVLHLVVEVRLWIKRNHLSSNIHVVESWSQCFCYLALLLWHREEHPGRPNHSWLRAIESDLRPLIINPFYVWKMAASWEHWHSTVDTAVLKKSMLWRERRASGL